MMNNTWNDNIDEAQQIARYREVKKLRKYLIGLAVAMASVLFIGVAAPMAIARAWTDCPSYAICVWSSSVFSGSPMYYWTAPTSQTCIPFGAAINDRTKGFVIRANNSPTARGTLYQHAGCSGAAIAIVQTIGGNTKNCTEQYGPWNTLVSSCTYPSGSSIWYNP